MKKAAAGLLTVAGTIYSGYVFTEYDTSQIDAICADLPENYPCRIELTDPAGHAPGRDPVFAPWSDVRSATSVDSLYLR